MQDYSPPAKGELEGVTPPPLIPPWQGGDNTSARFNKQFFCIILPRPTLTRNNTSYAAIYCNSLACNMFTCIAREQ